MLCVQCYTNIMDSTHPHNLLGFFWTHTNTAKNVQHKLITLRDRENEKRAIPTLGGDWRGGGEERHMRFSADTKLLWTTLERERGEWESVGVISFTPPPNRIATLFEWACTCGDAWVRKYKFCSCLQCQHSKDSELCCLWMGGDGWLSGGHPPGPTTPPFGRRARRADLNLN